MTIAIRFPAPSRYKTPSDFLDKGVHRWMLRVTGRHLYAHFKTGEVLPTADELRDWLQAEVWPKVSKYVLDYQDSRAKGKWTGEQFERELDRVVEFCLQGYDPVAVYLRSANGGKRSKRPPVWDVEHYLALPPGLTVAEQMTALGCKRSKLFELRARARDYVPLTTQKFVPPGNGR